MLRCHRKHPQTPPACVLPPARSSAHKLRQHISAAGLEIPAEPHEPPAASESPSPPTSRPRRESPQGISVLDRATARIQTSPLLSLCHKKKFPAARSKLSVPVALFPPFAPHPRSIECRRRPQRFARTLPPQSASQNPLTAARRMQDEYANPQTRAGRLYPRSRFHRT